MTLFKLSPSDLTFTWDECPFCFYMKVKHKVVLKGPFPGVFTRMANLTSSFYQDAPSSAISPSLPPGAVKYREKYVKSLPISFPGLESQAYINGRFDALIAFDDGSFGLVDYKTSDAHEEQVAFYARQLTAYAWALENPAPGALSLAPVTRMGLFVVTPERYEPSPAGEMVFANRLTWMDVPRDDAAFLDLIHQVLALLESPIPPTPNETCGTCAYRLHMDELHHQEILPVIISASRRTDIPAFYASWMLNRLRLGFCTVPNPFRPEQVSRLSLKPQDVPLIVFWTRHAAPLLPHLAEIDSLGYRYYFQYTLNNYPPALDGDCPSLEVALKTIHRLADHVGPGRVIWRYDPIVLTPQTGVKFHLANYRRIAAELKGAAFRSVVSLMDPYRKTEKRMQALAARGFPVTPLPPESPALRELMTGLASIAAEHGLEIVSCAEEIDLSSFGIRPGKCIDDAYILKTFGFAVDGRKDPSQRPACGCVLSRDIGIYDTCTFGCAYCYATTSFDRARANRKAHDPASPSLIGWHAVAGT